MIEEEIASQVTSLSNFVKRTVTHWGSWTCQYTKIKKEDLIQKMREALRETKFRPPLKEE